MINFKTNSGCNLAFNYLDKTIYLTGYNIHNKVKDNFVYIAKNNNSFVGWLLINRDTKFLSLNIEEKDSIYNMDTDTIHYYCEKIKNKVSEIKLDSIFDNKGIKVDGYSNNDIYREIMANYSSIPLYFLESGYLSFLGLKLKSESNDKLYFKLPDGRKMELNKSDVIDTKNESRIETSMELGKGEFRYGGIIDFSEDSKTIYGDNINKYFVVKSKVTSDNLKFVVGEAIFNDKARRTQSDDYKIRIEIKPNCLKIIRRTGHYEFRRKLELYIDPDSQQFKLLDLRNNCDGNCYDLKIGTTRNGNILIRKNREPLLEQGLNDIHESIKHIILNEEIKCFIIYTLDKLEREIPGIKLLIESNFNWLKTLLSTEYIENPDVEKIFNTVIPQRHYNAHYFKNMINKILLSSDITNEEKKSMIDKIVANIRCGEVRAEIEEYVANNKPSSLKRSLELAPKNNKAINN